jgi:hypothetical protein
MINMIMSNKPTVDKSIFFVDKIAQFLHVE